MEFRISFSRPGKSCNLRVGCGKQLGVFLLLPGWDASPFITGLLPSIVSLVPIYTPGWRESNMRVKSIAN